jgi:sigma-B regulation protein RsbU (phosphoserine phosphatase)
MDPLLPYINTEFIFNNAPIGIIAFEPNGRIVKGNETIYSWFNTTEAALKHISFFKLLTKGSNLYFQMVITPLLNLRGFTNEISFSFTSESGNFDTLLNAIAYKDDLGKVILINAYIIKITDRKKYEAELLLEKRLAEQSLSSANKRIDENKEQFFKIAMNQSHMIRRPLANMLGLLTILKDVSVPDEAENLIKLLELSAEDLDKLIKEVVVDTQKP